MEQLKKLGDIKNIHKVGSSFKNFLKDQGVITLAIGFILGTAISKFVSSLVTDIINPILNAALGGIDDLGTKVIHIGKSTIHYGTFLNNGIDFLVIAFVVFIAFKAFKMGNVPKADAKYINIK